MRRAALLLLCGVALADGPPVRDPALRRRIDQAIRRGADFFDPGPPAPRSAR